MPDQSLSPKGRNRASPRSKRKDIRALKKYCLGLHKKYLINESLVLYAVETKCGSGFEVVKLYQNSEPCTGLVLYNIGTQMHC